MRHGFATLGAIAAIAALAGCGSTSSGRSAGDSGSSPDSVRPGDGAAGDAQPRDAGDGGRRGDAGDAGDGGDGAATCTGVSVPPSKDLKSIVESMAAGTTFCLEPGVHRDFDVLNTSPVKDGDSFIGLPGASENGAKTLTGWTSVTLGGTSYWTLPGGAPIIDTYNPNMSCTDSTHATQTCYYSQALYLDNVTYEHAYRLSDVTMGKWYYEFYGLVNVNASPVTGGTGYKVGDVLAVAGGSGCPSLASGCGSVKVTSVGAGGAVTGVELRALGYGYPAGPVTEATTDTTTTAATGCTVSITAGSGGTTNNVYLAASEDPSAHTVEMGANMIPGAPQYLFHSDSAQDITIRGLIVEKYAGPLDFAPISVNHEGSTSGLAGGWVIEDNEIRLNMHDGITDGYGAAGSTTKILSNMIHDNGQEGIGGGNPSGSFIESYNEVYSNDTAWVPAGYGCGSIKHGGPAVGSGAYLISFNTVHDEPNGCDGLWSDVNMGNVTWDHNTVTNISGEGIRIEISGTGPIAVTNNTVTAGTAMGAQIDVVSSSNTTVQDNDVTTVGATPGIRVAYDGRACGTGCPSPPSKNVVSNNSITVTSTMNGGASRAEDFASNTTWLVSGIFDSNTYCVASVPWTTTSWLFGETGSPFLSFAAWQADGQDMHGVVTASTCPTAALP
jgi:hypothetical protein